MKYLASGIFVAAFGFAYGFSHSDDPGLRRLDSGVFALLLGLSALLWGVDELRSGRALVISQTARREAQPFVFWSVILVYRFAIGVVLLAAGIWRLATGGAT